VSYLGQLILLMSLFQMMALSTALVLWIIAGTSTSAVVVGLFRRGCITSPSGRFAEITRNHWRFSKWMMASALMQWFSGNFYFVAAGSVLGPVAVGGIKAAQNIIGVAHILFQAMENFAPAGAARALATGGTGLLTSYLRKLTLLGIAATSGIALIAWCYPSFLLTMLYGFAYGQYDFVLRWFCAIYIFAFLSMPLSAGLRAIEKTKPLFLTLFFVGVFSMVSAYPLVKWIGLNGVMFGLMITRVAMAATLFVSLRSYVSWFKNEC
jgi:O-antigen/teichoic acid export membrane protein